jgi:hypothetical protein
MAKAQINGNNVEVNAAVVNGALADVIYEISGKDASKLYYTLMDVGAKPSNLFEDGHFTISKKQLTDPSMNIPFLKILDKKLGAALPH